MGLFGKKHEAQFGVAVGVVGPPVAVADSTPSPTDGKIVEALLENARRVSAEKPSEAASAVVDALNQARGFIKERDGG